jgi:hypothetical protein
MMSAPIPELIPMPIDQPKMVAIVTLTLARAKIIRGIRAQLCPEVAIHRRCARGATDPAVTEPVGRVFPGAIDLRLE